MKRRQFLQGSGALVVGGVAGLSGCLGLGGDSGGTSTVGTDRLETWLPDPQAFDRNLDHYRFEASAPATLSEVVEGDAFASYDQDTQPGSPTDADVNVGTLSGTDVDLTFGASASTDSNSYGFKAYFGSFDAEWLGTKLENKNYNSFRGGGQDFTLYEEENGDDANSRVSALSEDVLIAGAQQTSDGEADGADVVETLIDASEGEATRYTDGSEAPVLEDMSDLLSALPDGHIFSGETQQPGDETNPEAGEFENLVAKGETRLFDGSKEEIIRVLVFNAASDVATPSIDSYIAGNESFSAFSEFSEEPSVTTDGRIVTIEGLGT